MSAAAPAADDRLPPYFPRVPKPCKAIAEEFFKCFSAGSIYEADKVRQEVRVLAVVARAGSADVFREFCRRREPALIR
jgi:hypothetical protein